MARAVLTKYPSRLYLSCKAKDKRRVTQDDKYNLQQDTDKKKQATYLRRYLHVVLAGPRQVGRTVPEAGVLLLVTGKVPVPDPDEAIKIEGEHATRGREREKGLMILPFARRQLESGAAVLWSDVTANVKSSCETIVRFE